MNEFEKILKKQNNEKKKNMIEQRLIILNSKAEQNKEIGVNTIHQGFISTTDSLEFSEVYVMSNLDEPLPSKYTMKNQDYIYEYINYLNKNNITDINTAILAISPFLKKYFGVGKNGNNKNNREISFDNMGMQLSEIRQKSEQLYQEYYSKWFDIAIFKNNSIAECTEYAALTQNILAFMGFNSYYISGYFSTKNTEGAHAFNLVQTTKEKFFLIDSANPTTIFDEKGNVISARTQSCIISEEQFKDAISEEGFEIELNVCNYQKINGTIQPIDEDIWKYQTKKKIHKEDKNINNIY